MKKQARLGLVVEGNSTTSAILHLPKIAEELGPVKSATLRVSRRLSNTLRAGYAVSEYEELQAARLILLRVPDSVVPRVVDEICATELVFKNLAFVLCESWLMLDVLERLRMRGSAVATLVRIPSTRRDWFIVEGQPVAVRQTRRFLERNEVRSIEIRPNTKPLYFAAELLATTVPMPLFLAAQQALRASGISGNPLSALLDEMAQKMFRDFLKGARMTWGGPLTECSLEIANQYFDNLRQSHPHLSQVLEEQLEWARARMAKQKAPAASSSNNRAGRL